jgi:hypothetical protein
MNRAHESPARRPSAEAKAAGGNQAVSSVWRSAVERRVPPAKREVLPGVTLTVSVIGGYSIERDGDYIGWIHASIGNRWNAYVRRPGTGGDLVGRFVQEEAVKAIMTAWDVRAALPAGHRS